MDFTIKTYISLLETIQCAGYCFQTFEQYLQNPLTKVVILRNDVDKKPEYALKIAQIQYQMGIKSTYYFRIGKKSFYDEIIKKIAELGHEIGYHYEDLSLARGDFKKAKMLFEKNLDVLRKYYPVKTMCMHGSPLSKWDNRLLWDKINYKDYNILGEPYFDLDFNIVFYLTDTGRRWDSEKSNIRDKIKTKSNIHIKTTYELISYFKNKKLPETVMINIHPQRWNNTILAWVMELIQQNIKNAAKTVLNKIRK
jgi:hypothetical protein